MWAVVTTNSVQPEIWRRVRSRVERQPPVECANLRNRGDTTRQARSTSGNLEGGIQSSSITSSPRDDRGYSGGARGAWSATSRLLRGQPGLLVQPDHGSSRLGNRARKSVAGKGIGRMLRTLRPLLQRSWTLGAGLYRHPITGLPGKECAA